ncbi:MAG: hypothetical protein LT081_12480 [Hydrogenophaga sp.]|nr:hypothetical protein [Hydrogenophaga sp.]
MSDQTLESLKALLEGFRSGQTDLQTFTTAARQVDALLATLPPRYGEVWRSLLDRLESSALFTEESCSFSQSELIQSLQLWIDKATAQRTSG